MNTADTCAIDPKLHMVHEFKKPDPVTVTGVPPSNEPKLGKTEITCEVAVGCCARMIGNKVTNQMQTAKSTA